MYLHANENGPNTAQMHVHMCIPNHTCTHAHTHPLTLFWLRCTHTHNCLV